MWFSTTFDITWYDEAVICVKNTFLIKKSFSHSIHSWRSLVNDIGEVMKYNWQSMTKLNGVKNAIMQVTYFLNGPMFNLLFCCHIVLYWEKVTSYFIWHISYHKSKLYGKFQRFNWSIEMLKIVEFPKIANINEKL